MKGYLQRLVDTAARDEPRVFPMAGSIFTDPVRDEDVDMSQPLLEMHANSDASPEGVEALVRPKQSDREEPVVRNEAGQRLPAVSGVLVSTKVEGQRLDTLTPNAEAPAAARAARDPFSNETPAAVRRERVMPRTEAVVIRPPHPEFTSQPDAESAEELIERDTAGSQFKSPVRGDLDERPSSLTPDQARSQRDSLIRRATGQPVNADRSEQVQIHIGRIEVIATPPAAARPAHAAPSRFTSLSDYLKRRNGRAE